MLNVCEQCVPFPARAVHAIPQTRYSVQCTYEMIKMPRVGFLFHNVKLYEVLFSPLAVIFVLQGPVVRRLICADPESNFNLDFFFSDNFLYSNRASNHQNYCRQKELN